MPQEMVVIGNEWNFGCCSERREFSIVRIFDEGKVVGIDQGVNHIRIPDAAVAGTSGGAELDIITLAGDQQLDVFDTASEAQVEVEAVGDDRGRQSAVADWARDESCPIVRD